MNPLLNGLLHGVAVEGTVPHLAVRLRERVTENLQRPVLGCGGKGKVAGGGQELFRLHQPVDFILCTLVILLGTRHTKRHRHCGRGTASLTGMRLVDDDGKVPPSLLTANLVKDIGKLLHRGDDDLLPFSNESAQIAGALGMANCRAHLRKLPNGIADLLVKDTPVSHHNNRVKNPFSLFFKADQLMGQPCNGVGLATPGGVASQGWPVSAVQISRSKPRSLVSVVIE